MGEEIITSTEQPIPVATHTIDDVYTILLSINIILVAIFTYFVVNGFLKYVFKGTK